MSTDEKGSQGGRWLLWIGFGLLMLVSLLSMVVAHRLNAGPGPGGEMPWQLLREQYVDGIVLGLGGLSCILLGLLALFLTRRYLSWANILIWLSFIYCAFPAWRSFVIRLRTDHLMSPTLARTSWPSARAYYDDPLILNGWIVILATVLLTTAASFFLGRGRGARVAQGSWRQS